MSAHATSVTRRSALVGKVEVSNEELRTVRHAMRELNGMVESLERGESEKFVLTKNGQMRAVVVSVEHLASLRSVLSNALSQPTAEVVG